LNPLQGTDIQLLEDVAHTGFEDIDHTVIASRDDSPPTLSEADVLRAHFEFPLPRYLKHACLGLICETEKCGTSGRVVETDDPFSPVDGSVSTVQQL
jgi:hypothetical protein